MNFKRKPPLTRHRFLHTLVFSSILILDSGACGTTDAGTPIQSPSSQVQVPAHSQRSDAKQTPLAPQSSSSSDTYMEANTIGVTPDSHQIPPAPEMAPEMAIDLRYCEQGWPTTKAGRGNSFRDCVPKERDDGTTQTQCVDREGACILR